MPRKRNEKPEKPVAEHGPDNCENCAVVAFAEAINQALHDAQRRGVDWETVTGLIARCLLGMCTLDDIPIGDRRNVAWKVARALTDLEGPQRHA